MAEMVKVRNEITGKVGEVPAKLFSSSAFNKDGVWTLYDGPLKADCGCNGQTVPEPEEHALEIDPYEKEVL